MFAAALNTAEIASASVIRTLVIVKLPRLKIIAKTETTVVTIMQINNALRGFVNLLPISITTIEKIVTATVSRAVINGGKCPVP